MKTLLSLFLIGLASPVLVAQSGFVLDPDGNYLPNRYRGIASAPGPDAPGDLLRTFAVSNGTFLSGYAPRDSHVQITPTSAGQWANLSGGAPVMFGYDFNGVLRETLTITDLNDSWPGYDGSRDTVICVNAFDDTISGYDRFNGAPLFRVPTPTSGPVGSAYQGGNDWYWYCDWTTNEVIALNGTDLHNGIATVQDRFSTALQITRLAGVAYNCLDNTLIVGGRDQGLQVAYDANNKQVVATWPVLGGSINDPQGCGLSPESGVATTDFQDLDTRVHEGTVGVRPSLAGRKQGATVTVIFVNRTNMENRAVIGWSTQSGRRVLKGVQTCLGLPAMLAGRITLTGNPLSGIITFNVIVCPTYVQAGSVPSKTVGNVICLR